MSETDVNVPDYGPPPALASPETAPALAADRFSTEDRDRIFSSANWFFWIAGLSVVNSIIAHSGSQWGFIVGLGITQFADAIFAGSGGASTLIAVLFDAAAATVFVVIGFVARMFKLWAFVIGMVLYLIDGLLFLIVSDYLSLAFHVYALFCIFVGFNVLRKSGS